MYPTFTYYAKVHIIKDQRYCECGIIHNYRGIFEKKDLKKVKFKSVSDITCRSCREKFLNENPKS